MLKSVGTAKIAGEEFVIMVVHQKTVSYYYLLSKHHREDQQSMLFGGALDHPVRDALSYARDAVDNNYIYAAIKKKNIGGDMQSYGVYRTLLDVLGAIQKAASYSFRSADILLDNSRQLGENLEPVRDFMAKDEEVSVEYRKVDGFLTRLKFAGGDIELDYSEEPDYHYPSTKEIAPLLADLKAEDAGADIYNVNVRTVDYATVLRKMEDSSWYVTVGEDGIETFKKNYRDIQTKEAFEQEIVMGLVNGIKEARRTNGAPLLVSVDTETTGLDVYGVAPAYQSTVVAIPIAMKDDEAFVIFTGMEYFANVPIEYVKERLEPFLSRGLTDDPEVTVQTLEGAFTFRRSELWVTGHNIMFDRRALLVHGMEIWYDSDTMQMSFNLDPFLTKRKNSLKYITHKLLRCWTPELADVLGAGNEDKFRYLTDVRVARLYGGSDGDFSRLVFKALRKIYDECREFHRTDLFQAYLDQDVIPMNMVAGFDFNGIRVDRDRFIAEGEHVKKDIEIITDFAHRYVGRLIVSSNYDQQRKVIEAANNDIDNVIAMARKEGVSEGEIAELAARKRNPDDLPKPDMDNVPPYIFKFAGNDLVKVLYEILNYPKPVPKNQPGADSDSPPPKPSVNKDAMKKLMGVRLKEPCRLLSRDKLGSNGKPLILASEINQYKYPLAYLVSLIGPRKKEYDSYFEAFAKDSYGDRLCKDSKFTSIDTRRISNPLQTIKGSLKEFMLPYSDDYTMCDFDMSQVELRIMASLAHDAYTIDRMLDPEVDSHTECASDMSVGMSKDHFHKAAYLISAKERKQAKQINFGYPYGLGRRSMCERMFGDASDEHLAQTQRIIEAFEKARHVIVTFLGEVRDRTLKPVGECDEEPIPIPEILRKYLELGENIPVGIVRNLKGFYKLFQLDNMDDAKTGRIRRQSGNFPIQSFAAELFRIILIRLFKEMWRRGWMQNGWVKGHVLVHDEFLFSYAKRHIHPVELAIVLHKACTVKIAGHTNYYIGINIGDSWGECKADSSELPVKCVERLCQRWDAGEFAGEQVENHRAYMAKIRQDYISDRIFEVVREICPGIGKSCVDSARVLEGFKNYTVRKYVYECYKPLWTAAKSKDEKVSDDMAFDPCFASWALDRFGDGTRFITSDRKEVVLEAGLTVEPGGTRDVEISLDDPDDDYYKELPWALDGNESYYLDYDWNSTESEEDFYDLFDAESGKTVEEMRKVRPTAYANMSCIGNRATITARRKVHISLIESRLKADNLAEAGGVQLFYMYGGLPVRGSCVARTNLAKVDELIAEVRDSHAV